jgi:hypothetical protein
MLRSADPRRILMALLFAPPVLTGCDQVHSFVLGELDEAVVDEDDWGPFKLGMSMKEVIAIIKAKTGKEPQIDHLPGLNWHTIFFDDKMLTIQDGTLLCVHRSEQVTSEQVTSEQVKSEHGEQLFRLGDDEDGPMANQDSGEVDDE